MKKPSFDNYEPTIEVLLKWKIKDKFGYVHIKVTEVTVYNEREFQDLVDGICRVRNAVLQGRT